MASSRSRCQITPIAGQSRTYADEVVRWSFVFPEGEHEQSRIHPGTKPVQAVALRPLAHLDRDGLLSHGVLRGI